MKYFIYILLSIFIFTGCTQKHTQSISYKQTPKEIIKKDVKKEVLIKEQDKQAAIAQIEKEIKSDQIAIIYPSLTIGKYALEAINSINTYLLFKDIPFSIKTIDMLIQNQKSVKNAFDTVKNENITKVIALITIDQLDIILDIDGIEKINLFLPLINTYEVKNRSKLEKLNIVFGAISYKDQFKKLISYANNKPLVELYDNSVIGNALHNYLSDYKLFYNRKINDNNGWYRSILRKNIKKMRNSAIILNTPIVKSSILLSAITAEEVYPNKILSTQLNYTPLLFSLTQKNDRRNFIVANSIGKIPVELEEFNQLLGNNISYSWVNYACLVGVEYLMSNNIDYFKDLKLEQNQVVYPIKLYNVGQSSFELIRE